MAIGIPCDIHFVISGFNNLVKIKGALERPKSKTVDWKYLDMYDLYQNPRRKPNVFGDQEKCRHDGIQTLNQRRKRKNLSQKRF